MNKQCRPLTDEEVKRTMQSFTGRYALRNKALFLLGCSTGFRISELLSIKLRDIMIDGKVNNQVTITREHMKGKKKSRSAFIPPAAREIITEWVSFIRMYGICLPDDPLFCTLSGKQMSRINAWKILKKAYTNARLFGNLGTHSMRKTFARKMYEYGEKNRNSIGREPLIFVFEQLGHIKIDSTMKYLRSCLTEFQEAAASEAVQNWLT